MTGMVQQVRRPTGGKHGGVVVISIQRCYITRARSRSHTHRLSQQYSVMALMRSESGLWVFFFFFSDEDTASRVWDVRGRVGLLAGGDTGRWRPSSCHVSLLLQGSSSRS